MTANANIFIYRYFDLVFLFLFFFLFLYHYFDLIFIFSLCPYFYKLNSPRFARRNLSDLPQFYRILSWQYMLTNLHFSSYIYAELSVSNPGHWIIDSSVPRWKDADYNNSGMKFSTMVWMLLYIIFYDGIVIVAKSFKCGIFPCLAWYKFPTEFKQTLWCLGVDKYPLSLIGQFLAILEPSHNLLSMSNRNSLKTEVPKYSH